MLEQALADHIVANSSLVVDTNLFIGGLTIDSPTSAVVIRETMGSTENESGMQHRAIQVLSYALGYVNSKTLINTVYEILKNKPGFADISGRILYCRVLSMPGYVDRDEIGCYVFSAMFLVAKDSASEAEYES